MLQKKEVLALVRVLKKKKHRIVLETNGSIYDKAVFSAVDAVACDMKPPSSGEKSDERILAKLSPKDYVKVVVADGRDLEYAKKIAEKSRVEVFLQPADVGKIGWLAKEVLKQKIDARALPQLHKIIGVK
jgi:organic radical activating enzyme